MSPLWGRGADPAAARIDARALDERLTGLRRAAEAAHGRLPDPPIQQALLVLGRAEQRRSVAPDLTVVALAGATGAGKSSLFNSIVGEQVATAGVTRPTTGEPQAALWTTPAAAAPLLEWLGVTRQHVVAVPAGGEFEGLVLLDLPDMDSTVRSHRDQVDHLVERVDMMVWVLDPQKYADAAVHDAYLRRFARHGDVTTVVLNQVDRLTPTEAEECVADLGRLVAADGLPSARVLGISARTGLGQDELHRILTQAVGERQAAMQRLAADIATAADGLAVAAADPGTDVSRVPAAQDRALTEALTDAAGAPLVERAVHDSMRMRGARATGWPPVRWIHRLRSDPVRRLRLGREGVDAALVRTSLPSASPVSVAQVAAGARDYAAASSQGAPAAWVRSTRAVAVGAAEKIGPHLDTAVASADVGSPRTPRWWSLVGLLQWLLFAVAAAGALWLVGLMVLRWLALPAPDTPAFGRLPVPTAMLIAGAVAGILLAFLAGLGVRVSASRAAAKARRAVAEHVAEVGQVRIVDPVSAELATLAEFRVGVVAAQGG